MHVGSISWTFFQRMLLTRDLTYISLFRKKIYKCQHLYLCSMAFEMPKTCGDVSNI